MTGYLLDHWRYTWPDVWSVLARSRKASPTNNDPRTSDNCAFPNRTARHGFAGKDLLESRLRRCLISNPY
jgi:hypothetical protein